MRAGGAGQSVSTGGGDVHGGIYQAGRDFYYYAGRCDPPSVEYEAIPKWRSPFTQGVLSWLSVTLGLAGFFPLWKVLQPVYQLFTEGLDLSERRAVQSWWIWVFIATFLMFVLVMSLRRLTKFQLRQPLYLGWALSGVGRRLTLEKIRAEACARCGGKMRYYSKPMFEDYVDANGKARRVVTKRVPALECRRNPSHWYEVDPAEVTEI